MTDIKQLVYCPHCEKSGKKEVLGALVRGRFTVLRFHRGETIIKGENFEVFCGVCGNRVYYRTKFTEDNGKKESTNNRV